MVKLETWIFYHVHFASFFHFFHTYLPLTNFWFFWFDFKFTKYSVLWSWNFTVSPFGGTFYNSTSDPDATWLVSNFSFQTDPGVTSGSQLKLSILFFKISPLLCSCIYMYPTISIQNKKYKLPSPFPKKKHDFREIFVYYNLCELKRYIVSFPNQ